MNCWSPEGSAWIDVFVWVGFVARPPLASAEDEWGRSDDDDPFSKVAAFTKFSLVSPLTMETSYRFTFLVRYAQNNTFPYFLTGFQNSTVPFHLSSHEHNTIILIWISSKIFQSFHGWRAHLIYRFCWFCCLSCRLWCGGKRCSCLTGNLYFFIFQEGCKRCGGRFCCKEWGSFVDQSLQVF